MAFQFQSNNVNLEYLNMMNADLKGEATGTQASDSFRSNISALGYDPNQWTAYDNYLDLSKFGTNNTLLTALTRNKYVALRNNQTGELKFVTSNGREDVTNSMNKNKFDFLQMNDIVNKHYNSTFANSNIPTVNGGIELNLSMFSSPVLKHGGKSKIHIKPSHEGRFTEYCGGNVTEECIRKGKNSPDPKIRKQATFAANARKWKHENGGSLNYLSYFKIGGSILYLRKGFSIYGTRKMEALKNALATGKNVDENNNITYTNALGKTKSVKGATMHTITDTQGNPKQVIGFESRPGYDQSAFLNDDGNMQLIVNENEVIDPGFSLYENNGRRFERIADSPVMDLLKYTDTPGYARKSNRLNLLKSSLRDMTIPEIRLANKKIKAIRKQMNEKNATYNNARDLYFRLKSIYEDNIIPKDLQDTK